MLIQLEKLDARVPRWNMGALVERDCPFCGSDNEAALNRPDGLPVAFCRLCGCWYVGQLPPPSEIERIYERYYHDYRPAYLSMKTVPRLLENARRASGEDWQLAVLSRLLGGLKGKRVLDVGCGWGRFLAMARSAGADVVGCDLSPEACEFARDGLDIVVYQSDLHSCSSSIGAVDAIVMRDFIEHPAEPLRDTEAAYQLLKPGGLLLWQTPNAGDAGVDIETAKQWVGFRVDLEHFQYVSPRTVNWLAHRLDMSIERLDAFGFPGLKGIDRLPKRRGTRADRARDFAGQIPGMHAIVRCLRVVRMKARRANADPRLGSFHLFAVLRKV